MRKTIRKVTRLVLVLMTSCQVSLNAKSGPVIAQMRITETAVMKVKGRPVACAVDFVNRVNQLRDRVGRNCASVCATVSLSPRLAARAKSRVGPPLLNGGAGRDENCAD